MTIQPPQLDDTVLCIITRVEDGGVRRGYWSKAVPFRNWGTDPQDIYLRVSDQTYWMWLDEDTWLGPWHDEETAVAVFYLYTPETR